MNKEILLILEYLSIILASATGFLIGFALLLFIYGIY